MAYINQNGELINSEIVTCFDGAVCHIDDAVYVESINHFAQYDQVTAGENGYELLPELMAALRNDAVFAECEKDIKSLNEKLVQFRELNAHDLFAETRKQHYKAMKKLAETSGNKQNEALKMNVELSPDQLATIEASFKIEHLKDVILLEKLLSDDYDFDLLDDNE